jgi:hypothetical protein
MHDNALQSLLPLNILIILIYDAKYIESYSIADKYYINYYL